MTWTEVEGEVLRIRSNDQGSISGEVSNLGAGLE